LSGTLFVVATPIGHLGDLSDRARQVLSSVALIAAEDTRHTRKLLDHIGSTVPLASVHAHSDPRRLGQVVDRLVAGDDVALCTDAGTPAISDPGPALVTEARRRGIAVVPIPGPSAVPAALSVTGWPADHYLFLGFPPRKGGERERWLDRIRDAAESVVCFEAPGRTAALVRDLAGRCGADRRVMLGREMTKVHEEYRVTTLGELARELADSEPRGEVTLVIEAAEPVGAQPDRSAARELAAVLARAGLEPSRIARIVAEVHGLSRNESYRVSLEEAP